MQEVTELRTVWLAQLGTIGQEYLPHTSPHHPLSTLSPGQIRDDVVNLTHLQSALETPNSLKLLKENAITFAEPSSRIVEPRFVPGGKEIFLVQSGRLEMWNLEDCKHICSAPHPPTHPYCTAIDSDLSIDGSMIMLTARYSTNDGGPGTRDRYVTCNFNC